MKSVKRFLPGEEIPSKAIFLHTTTEKVLTDSILPNGNTIKLDIEKQVFYYEVPDKISTPGQAKQLDWKSIVVEVLDYLNYKTGKKYSAKAKGNQDIIKPRILQDKYSLEDFKRLIDNKCADWMDDPEMSKYLRPETLFSKKHFESYLNETPAGQQEEDLFAELESYNIKGENHEG